MFSKLLTEAILWGSLQSRTLEYDVLYEHQTLKYEELSVALPLSLLMKVLLTRTSRVSCLKSIAIIIDA